MSAEHATLRSDVEALARMRRSSASPAEVAAARWVARRLHEAGAMDVRTERYRAQGTYAWAHAAHLAAGLGAAWLGRRRARLTAAALSAGALASLELDGSGRSPWLRRVLPSREGANAIGHLPGHGRRRGRLVLVAHHDAARTGLVWHPRVTGPGAARRLRRRSIDGYLLPAAAGFGLVAAGALADRALPRRAGAAVLATALAGEVDVALSPTVPGASDNATGVAAMLALCARLAAEPLPGVDVIALATGSEESGMGGMRAFLHEHIPALRAVPTLVLGLDTLGAGTPIVLRGEGVLREHRYRAEDLALADRGAFLAGRRAPERWRIGGWTDPVLARFAGLPAISLLSIGPQGVFTRYHRPDDLPEHVDWTSVEACLDVAHGTARAFAERVGC